MPVDLFEDLEHIRFQGQIFIDEKPGYFNFANQTEMKTGQELFAEFMSSQQDQ